MKTLEGMSYYKWTGLAEGDGYWTAFLIRAPGPGAPTLDTSGHTQESAENNLGEVLRQFGWRGKLTIDHGDGVRVYRVYSNEVVRKTRMEKAERVAAHRA